MQLYNLSSSNSDVVLDMVRTLKMVEHRLLLLSFEILGVDTQ